MTRDCLSRPCLLFPVFFLLLIMALVDTTNHRDFQFLLLCPPTHPAGFVESEEVMPWMRNFFFLISSPTQKNLQPHRSSSRVDLFLLFSLLYIVWTCLKFYVYEHTTNSVSLRMEFVLASKPYLWLEIVYRDPVYCFLFSFFFWLWH